jgi:L-ascorbate oxidase
VLQDNMPLGIATPDATIANQAADNQNGVCTVAQWRAAHCRSTPLVLDIPFAELGDFVYHCHILEHEDGGMMARIQVVPAPL